MIVLITGMMAAGKSSIGQALAERLQPSLHLRGDIYRKMIVNGRQDMANEASPDAIAQLRLRYDAAASTAILYSQAGFNVIYQDVIIGPVLEEVAERLGDELTQLIVLNPQLEVVEQREHARAKVGYTQFSVQEFAQVFQTTPRLGYWLDNSTQTVEQSVSEIMALLEETRQLGG